MAGRPHVFCNHQVGPVHLAWVGTEVVVMEVVALEMDMFRQKKQSQYVPQGASSSKFQNSGNGRAPQRDALDSFVDCDIPGLQSHYGGKAGKSLSSQENALYAAASARSGPQSGPLSGQEYAAQLKAQIDAKAMMNKSGRGNRTPPDTYQRGNSSSAYQQDPDDRYPGRRASPQLIAAGANSSKSNGYRVQNPPGGASSLSLGWN